MKQAKNRSQYSLKTVLLLILLVALGAFAKMVIEAGREDVTIAEHSVFPRAISAESRVLLVGETFWGRYIRDAALASEKGYAFPFSGLESLDRTKYDAWIGHLECPVTDNSLTSAEQEATLTFNCRPEFLEEAAKWFDVFSLANNHTDNMGGQIGLNESRAHLEEAGIQHYGHYDNAVKDELCEVVNLPLRVEYSSGQIKAEQLPVAMCGYHGVFKVPTDDELDVISEYSKYFLTIVTPQMGAEYQPAADQIKTDTYRAMIDRGADMVVASHPHWVQNTEVYKGKLIMYSIGNFIFDQQDSEEVRRGVGLDLSLSIDPTAAKDWFKLAEHCSEFNDDCLTRATESSLHKLDIDIDYDIVASLNTGYVTSAAPQAVADRVIQRLNWEDTVAKLKE